MTAATAVSERLLQLAGQRFEQLRRIHPDVGRYLVTILTGEELRPELKDAMLAHWCELVGNKQAPVQFGVAPHIAPGDVLVRSSVDPDRTEQFAFRRVAETTGWHPESRVMSIREAKGGAPHNFLIQPTTGADWGTISGGFGSDSASSALRVGESLPTAELLGYQLVEIGAGLHRLVLRRTGSSPEVIVTIDGARLEPGQDVTVVPDTGYVTVVAETQEKCWEVSLSTSPVRDFKLALGVHRQLDVQRLDINHLNGSFVAVRSPGMSGGQLKDFAIPGLDRTTLCFEAAVITTIGDGPHGDHFHVKIYRCATAVQAEALQDFLLNQMSLIGRAPSRYLPDVVIAGLDPATPTRQAPVEFTARAGSAAAPPVGIDEGRGLAGWFGVPYTGDLSAYVAVLSPLLADPLWSNPPEDVGSPALHTLRRFLPMAAALDNLHRSRAVHGDIKAANVCYRNDDPDSPFALIDADSVTHIDHDPLLTRTTWEMASPGLRAARRGGVPEDRFLLRTNDRYAFVLLMLRSLTDPVTFREWTGERMSSRPIEDPQFIADELTRRWGARWGGLARRLVSALDDRVWTGDGAFLHPWLHNLVSVSISPDPPTSPDLPWGGRRPDVSPRSPVDDLVEELRQVTVSSGKRAVDDAVWEALASQTSRIAEVNWRHRYLLAIGLIGGLTALLVVLVVMLAIGGLST